MPGFGGAVKLTGESEYREAIKSITQELKEMSSELQLTATKFDSNDTSINSLQSKYEALNKVLEEQKKVVDEARAAYESFGQKVEEQRTKHEALEKEYKSAVAELERIKNTSGETSQEFKEQSEVVNKLASEYGQSTKAQNENEIALSKLKTTLNNAESAYNKTATEVDKLGNEMAEAEKPTDDLGDALEDSGEKADKAAKGGWSVIGQVVADFAHNIISKAVEAVKDFAKAVVDTGMEFDSAMSKVQAVSGASADEMVLLRDKAKEMGETTKFSASESAEAFNYMAMAGWKTEDMLNGIEGVMALAAASGADLATTSDIVTDALTAMGYSTESAGRLADVMAAASSNANTNVEMMGETFKYAAPVVGALGMNMEDTAIAIGLMANSGIKASQAGTSLRSIVTRLAAPTKESGTMMDKLGISVTYADGSMKSLSEIMVELRSRFAGLSQEEQAQAASALAGKNAMSGLLAIVNASDEDFNKLTEAVYHSDGAAKSMADTMLNNLGGDMTLLKSKLEGVQIALYEKLEPALRSGVEALSKLLDAFSWIVDHGETIKAVLIGLATAVGTYVAYTTAIKVMKEGWMALEIVQKAVTAAQWLMNAAMSANPIGIVVAAVAGLTAGLIALWSKSEGFRNFFANMWEHITGLVKKFAEAWNNLKDKIVGIWDNLKTKAQEKWESIKNAVSSATDRAKTAIENKWNDIKNSVTNIWNQTKEACSTTWNAAKDAAIKAIQDGKSPMVAGWEGIKAGIKSVWDRMPDVIKNPITNVTNALSNIWTKIKDTASNAWKNIVNTVVSIFTDLPKRVVNIGTDMVKGLWEGIKNAGEWIWSKIKGFCSGITDKIKGFFGIHSPSTVFEKEIGANLALGIGEGFTNTMNAVARDMGDAIPTSFDAGGASGAADYGLVSAFKAALAEVKIEIDDEVAGRFVDRTVSRLVFS